MNRLKLMYFWSAGVGAMDALTGVVLILAPEFVTDLLHIPRPDVEALMFLSWIGVFVIAVGLSYGLVFGARSAGATVWTITGATRMLVFIFLTIQVVSQRMPMAWMLVAVSDGVVGFVQLALLKAGWWKEERG